MGQRCLLLRPAKNDARKPGGRSPPRERPICPRGGGALGPSYSGAAIQAAEAFPSEELLRSALVGTSGALWRWTYVHTI